MNRANLMIKMKYALRFLPDLIYIKLYFRLTLKRKLNLKNPITLNEKLQWMKFNDRNPMYTMVSDKLAVRPYIEQVIGKEYLVPLLGKWDNFDDIDFNTLPCQFVLKCNHDSGGLVLCKNKDQLNIKAAKRKINESLRRQFYYIGREWQYKAIKPTIFAEALLLDEDGNPPADYKISCFNGEIDNIMVCIDRFTESGVKFYFFDKDWNFLRYNKDDDKLPADFTIKKPDNLNEMLEIARKLSKPFNFARIDLYNIKGKIYFSEITLSPNSGFDTDITYETDLLLGEKLHIPYAF
ncbi:ATP-grasp fold amidoligase family protein [Longibaculum muris]|uniref:ATP-grasp fold amidoligase family protein n=1 Tax=Longibaculum muris TaxID=1796628 RepID=UPI0022E26C05|nr:ATP-grasp fold amidoligase family protein [Longibaculum muris]